MARQYGHQKIDLALTLELVAEVEPIRYGWLVLELCDYFDCSQRAAKDAISILRRGRWIEPSQSQPGSALGPGDPHSAPTRYADYRVSTRGHALQEYPEGPALLRVARKLFTTCPSPKVRRFQRTIQAEEGLDEALRRVEAATLTRDDPPPRSLALARR
jgi:hypothetical protein